MRNIHNTFGKTLKYYHFTCKISRANIRKYRTHIQVYAYRFSHHFYAMITFKYYVIKTMYYLHTKITVIDLIDLKHNLDTNRCSGETKLCKKLCYHLSLIRTL